MVDFKIQAFIANALGIGGVSSIEIVKLQQVVTALGNIALIGLQVTISVITLYYILKKGKSNGNEESR